MRPATFHSSHRKQFTILGLIALTSLSLHLPPTAAGAGKEPVVPKWHRFEQAFKSSVAYTNPLQDVTLTVRFTSPLGSTMTRRGFWDGGRTWRVRFSPDQPGEWRFETTCSDTANRGMHAQTGTFLCSAALGGSRFERHGPIVVSRDHRHFQHTDGTPFFWMADTAWEGARVSEPKDWDLYSQVRASQGFSVIQWAAAPGEDFRNESALTGFPDQVGVNPEVFRRLDAKLDLLSQEGLLSAIAPLLELQTNVLLRQDQAALVVQYVVARWGADPVAFLLNCSTGATNGTSRWKNIGRDVFGEGRHTPVIVVGSHAVSDLNDFRDESWADALGYEPVHDLSENLLRQTLVEAMGKIWSSQSPRPVVVFTPYENAVVGGTQKRFSAEDVRRAAYWGQTIVPPAGISYGGQGVINWDDTVDSGADKTPGARLPLWQKAMFMPGAKQMGRLAGFITACDYRRLEPASKAIAVQPGDSDRNRYISAAATESKDLVLVYVPQDRTLELFLDAMPTSPGVTWFNPRTSETSPAVAVVVGRSCQFPTPNPGDWVLVLKGGK